MLLADALYPLVADGAQEGGDHLVGVPPLCRRRGNLEVPGVEDVLYGSGGHRIGVEVPADQRDLPDQPNRRSRRQRTLVPGIPLVVISGRCEVGLFNQNKSVSKSLLSRYLIN